MITAARTKLELKLSPAGRCYNALPSPVDHRDYGVGSFLRRVAAAPSSFDLESTCGPVRDQLSKGSCTGHAGYAMRMQLANAHQGNANKIIFSPEEIYDMARYLDGTLTSGDVGSCGRTIVQVLQKYGTCPEADDPYTATNLSVEPSAQALVDAAKYKAGAYHALSNVEDMKLCISSGYGFIVGFAVYDSFESSQVASTGMMPVPDKNKEQNLGGHEVYFMGYDDAVNCFKVQNSWGKIWGKNGFFWFPYQCAADSTILFDAFIQHLGPAWK